MKKRGAAPIIIITVIYTVFLNFLNPVSAVENKKNPSEKPDFLTDTLYTDTINLTQTQEEQLIEIIIARWGTNETTSRFELSIKSTPGFMEKVKWVEGSSRLVFQPHETEKRVVLSFHAKAAALPGKEDLVLLVKSRNKDLVPQVRQIVLPFKGPKSGFQSDVSIIVCPFDSDKNKENEKDKICEENVPVHAGDDYKVLVDPGLDWETAFELRLIDPENKVVDTVINNNHHLEHLKNSGEFKPKIVKTADKNHPVKLLFNIVSNVKEGEYRVETRTKVVEEKNSSAGLLGTSSYIPSFEGQWQPIGIYKVLPKPEDKGPLIEMVLAEVRVSPDSDEVSFEKGSSGASILDEYGYSDSLSSIKLTDYPTSITMGRAFSVRAEVEFTGINKGGKYSLCYDKTRKKTIENTFHKGAIFNHVYVQGNAPVMPVCGPFPSTKHDIVRKSKAFLNINYEPLNYFSKSSSEGLKGIYTYTLSPSGSSEPMSGMKTTYKSQINENPLYSQRQIATFEFEPAQKPEEKYNKFREGVLGPSYHRHNQLDITFSFNIVKSIPEISITLIYKPASLFANPLKRLSEYSHPQIADSRKTGEEGLNPDIVKSDNKINDNLNNDDMSGGGVNTQTNQESTDQISPGINETVLEPENPTPRNSKIKEAGLDPDNPDGINPNLPQIAAIIKNWIKVAKPPSNATHGNNLHYSNRGIAIGKGKGFIAESRHESGKFDPLFLWKNKRSLDSVDHCTLGEYVIAKLKGASIDYCRGRYKAMDDYEKQSDPTDKESNKKGITLPNLMGRPAKDAKKVLSDKGFKVELLAGKAAPTPKQAYTVTDMDPEPGAVLKKGEVIKLTVFVDYAQQVKIPSISGLSTVKAKKRLQDAGFKVKLKTKGNSPSPEGAFKTIGTDPVSNSKAAKGSTITLISFGPYKDQVKMPSVVGLKLNQAEMALEKLGLDSLSLHDKPAPEKEMEDVVTYQEPKAGTVVSPRTSIRLKYYDTYQWKGLMPDLSGLTADQARDKMVGTGIDIRVSTGIPAPSARMVDKIYEQSVKKNTPSKEGDSLKVTRYGKTKEQYVALKDCTGLPGTEPFWNPETGKPACRCKDGYLIRSDKSGCDKKAKPAPQPAMVRQNNSSKTKYVLDRVIFSKFKAQSDLCGDDMTCKYEKYFASNHKFEKHYSISEGKAEFKFKDTYVPNGNVESNYRATFRFDSPPSTIYEGDILSLNTTAEASGFTKGWHYNRTFHYYIKKSGRNSYYKKTGVAVSNRDLPVNGKLFKGNLSRKSTTTITVPKISTKEKELVIGGKHGWDPGHYIDWIYKKIEKKESKPALPPASVKKTSSACDQYYSKLNRLIKQQQQISNQMINNPATVNKSSCELLEIARETITLAKKARASGCRIDGNLEQSSKMFIDVYKQTCKGAAGVSTKKKIEKKEAKHKGAPHVYFPYKIFKIPMEWTSGGSNWGYSRSSKDKLRQMNSKGWVKFKTPGDSGWFTDYHGLSYIVVGYSHNDNFPSVTASVYWQEVGHKLDDNKRNRELLDNSCNSQMSRFRIKRKSRGAFELIYGSSTHRVIVKMRGYEIFERRNMPSTPAVENFLKQLADDLISQVKPYAVRCR